ncbi:Vacuolar membrane protein [Drechslerella dactyloides]|uniref:Vacuolar membrane protein n=1 Tax=Drechslerella dactyloides TaxID=74499 RepID=A0AAD6J393_DREDA|nr:Vacuolar membrane protein [Drechslerella dactyloides]
MTLLASTDLMLRVPVHARRSAAQVTNIYTSVPALLVQAALGALALLSLVYKRWRERPQRPVKIWFFDASKQVVGSILVHIANLLLAMLSSGKFDTTPHPGRALIRRWDDGYHPNPCSFYLLNLAIDTTVGIAILIYALRLLTYLCEQLPPDNAFSHGITSGDYGHPPKASNWIKQSGITPRTLHQAFQKLTFTLTVLYFAGLMIMKLVVALLFAIFPVVLGKFGDFLLGWTEGNRKVQIAFVMFIFPLIMNAVQYYIIDTFIKKQEAKSPHLPVSIDGDSSDDDDAFGDEDDTERASFAKRGRRGSRGEQYDEVPHDMNTPQLQPSSAAGAAAGGSRQKLNGGQTRTRSFEDSSYVYSTDEDDEHAITAAEGKTTLPKSQRGKRKGEAGGEGERKNGNIRMKIDEYDPEVDGDNTVRR